MKALRVRSPTYPRAGLREICVRFVAIYLAHGADWLGLESAVQRLGFASLSGWALSLITTAAKFGIIERDGRRLRLTRRAATIFSPEHHMERKAALWEAINGNEVFSLLVREERAQGTEALQPKLLSLGFTPAAAERALAAYRESVEFARKPPRGPFGEHAAGWDLRPKRARVGGSHELSAILIVPADVAVVENGVIVGAHLTAEADLDALIAALEAIRGHLKNLHRRFGSRASGSRSSDS